MKRQNLDLKKSARGSILCRDFCKVVLLLSAIFMVQIQPLSADSRPPEMKTIISASEYDYPPFCIVNENDLAGGFSVELLRETLKVMGRDVSFKLGPWFEVKQSLIDKKVQVLPLVGRTPEREGFFDFTFPYMTMHGTIIVRSGTNEINSLADLSGKNVAVMQGDNAEEFLLREKIPGILTRTKSFDVALKNLAQGEYDAVVVQKLLATQIIKEHQLTNLKPVGPPLEGFVQSFCFAVAKGDSSLLSRLNEGLSIVIANGTFEALRKKWFSDLESVPNSRILVGGDFNYPPYEYLDENGQPAGYNVDLTRAIARHLGIAVNIQLAPWGDVRKKLENNQIDLVQGMFYSTEREKTLSFTDAHTLVSHVLITRKGTTPLRSLAEFSGKIIVVMDGDIMHDLAVNAGYGKQLILVQTQQEALWLLSSGGADYALLAKIPALYWIAKETLTNLEVGENDFISSEYCYAANHKNQALIERFSLGLTNLKATGEYREIHQKWFGSYEDQGISRQALIRYLLLGAIPLCGLFIFSIVWTKTLKMKVRTRTAELVNEIEERKKVEDKLADQAERLKASQSMLIQQEKLAAIGQLAAGVAHEINNPLGYISSNLNTLGNYREKLDKYLSSLREAFLLLPVDQQQLIAKSRKQHKIDLVLEDLPDIISDAFEGTERIKKIVLGMKCFSRTDSDVPLPVDINECLESAITIVWNEIKYNSELERDFTEVPTLDGFPQQLSQVFMNLLVNASHAIHEKGQIHLKSRFVDGQVVVTVTDNGSGISEMTMTKIFDPFFTTKDPGKGTGLGMSIAREIIQKHGGRIEVQSEVGKGSEFTVSLPVAEKYIHP